MAIINPPAYMQNGEYTAAQDRLILETFVPNHGIARGFVVTQTPTASMGIRVSAGRAFVKALGTNQGSYHVVNDGVVDLPVDAAHATYGRIDKVILRVADAAITGAVNEAVIEVLTGTPASTPSAPGTPSSSIVLAHVHVPAKSTTVINSRIVTVNVADVARIDYSLAPQAIKVTSTTRPTQDLTDGMIIQETDTGFTRIRVGSSWKYLTGDDYAGGSITNVVQSEATGWDINSANAIIRGGVVQVYVTFTRSITTVINVPSNGNISNSTICTIRPEYRPFLTASASSISSGRTAGGYASPSGALVLANVAPGQDITKDQVFSLGYTAALASSVYSV